MNEPRRIHPRTEEGRLRLAKTSLEGAAVRFYRLAQMFEHAEEPEAAAIAREWERETFEAAARIFDLDQSTISAPEPAPANDIIEIIDLAVGRRSVLPSGARASGVSRDACHPRSLVVYFRSMPTDDDMRALHDFLSTPPGEAAPRHSAPLPRASEGPPQSSVGDA